MTCNRNGFVNQELSIEQTRDFEHLGAFCVGPKPQTQHFLHLPLQHFLSDRDGRRRCSVVCRIQMLVHRLHMDVPPWLKLPSKCLHLSQIHREWLNRGTIRSKYRNIAPGSWRSVRGVASPTRQFLFHQLLKNEKQVRKTIITYKSNMQLCH